MGPVYRMVPDIVVQLHKNFSDIVKWLHVYFS